MHSRIALVLLYMHPAGKPRPALAHSARNAGVRQPLAVSPVYVIPYYYSFVAGLDVPEISRAADV